MPLFKVNRVPEHDGAVERQTGLRTVRGDKLDDRVVIGALATGGGQTAQNSGVRLFEIGERQNAFGARPGRGRSPPEFSGAGAARFWLPKPCNAIDDKEPPVDSRATAGGPHQGRKPVAQLHINSLNGLR